MGRRQPDVIRLEGVSKAFPIHDALKGARSLKGMLARGGWRGAERQRPRRRGVLREVELAVQQGDFLGILGSNGAGKSTLLKLIAGIYRPDTGLIRRRGRLASLLELGTGFHPDFTGRENALINGAILGLSFREVRRRLPQIIEFSGLEDKIDAPVRTYSSGMYVRLGFSVAVHVLPTILLVDEVLAVGDQEFRARCLERIRSLSRAGTTILFVSHDTHLVEQLATRGVLVESGRVVEYGSVRQAIENYASPASGSMPTAIETIPEEIQR